MTLKAPLQKTPSDGRINAPGCLWNNGLRLDVRRTPGEDKGQEGRRAERSARKGGAAMAAFGMLLEMRKATGEFQGDRWPSRWS